MITTRLADLHDVEAVASLFDSYRQFYEQPPDPDLARQFITDRLQRAESKIIVAMNPDHQVVGFCQLYPSFCSVEAKPIYVLYDLFVAPAARRSGAGTCLLRAAEDTARADCKARMDLTTARTNQAAQAAYAAQGWIRDDVFFAYSKRIEG